MAWTNCLLEAETWNRPVRLLILLVAVFLVYEALRRFFSKKDRD